MQNSHCAISVEEGVCWIMVYSEIMLGTLPIYRRMEGRGSCGERKG